MIDEMHWYILLDLSKKKDRAFICLRWKYTFNVKGDWWFFPRKSWFDFLWIRESWSMVIRSYDIYVGEFFYLNVHELWVESWIKRDSWTILFCVMHFRLFYRFGNVRIFLERLWLGFDKGFDKRWKSYGSIIVTKQISNGSWTNEIGHCSIVCHVRLVKTKESIISILRDFFEFRVNLKAFWILFVIRKKAKYFYVTEFNKRV